MDKQPIFPFHAYDAALFYGLWQFCHIASITFSRDLMEEIYPAISDRQQVVIGKFFVWVVVIISFFVAKFQHSIMKWIMLGYACITCQIIPPYGGLLSKRATPSSRVWSLMLSIIGVITWELLGKPGNINSVFVALTLGIIGFLLGGLNKKGVTEEQMDLVDKFYNKADSNYKL